MNLIQISIILFSGSMLIYGNPSSASFDVVVIPSQSQPSNTFLIMIPLALELELGCGSNGRLAGSMHLKEAKKGHLLALTCSKSRFSLIVNGESTHFEEHRYCSNGTRYFPQKSTNLMCSMRLSKKTPAKKNKIGIRLVLALFRFVIYLGNIVLPLHFGLTQQ